MAADVQDEDESALDGAESLGKSDDVDDQRSPTETSETTQIKSNEENELNDDSASRHHELEHSKLNTEWSLPIRAAPIFAMQGEEVIEFPLSQHVSGRESTSIVVDEELLRIVESSYGDDGIRRLNVRLALVKQYISGYSHTHLDVFVKMNPVWYSLIGFGFLMWALQSTIPVLSAAGFILFGIAGLLLAKLDLHRISFSDHGGRHDFLLSGWNQDPFLIYNSTALLGPAVVGFLRTGEFETEHIEAITRGMQEFVAPQEHIPAQINVQTMLPQPTQSALSDGEAMQSHTPEHGVNQLDEKSDIEISSVGESAPHPPEDALKAPLQSAGPPSGISVSVPIVKAQSIPPPPTTTEAQANTKMAPPPPLPPIANPKPSIASITPPPPPPSQAPPPPLQAGLIPAPPPISIAQTLPPLPPLPSIPPNGAIFSSTEEDALWDDLS